MTPFRLLYRKMQTPRFLLTQHPPIPSKMSTAKHCFSGNGKAPLEKSKFAQTCNRLSLFLKEKGNLRDLGFELNANIDAKGRLEASAAPVVTPSETTTADLLRNMENPDQKAVHTEKSLNILPQISSLNSSWKLEDSSNKASSSNPRYEAAQMTIFYGGQVLVFDDIPADRARDLILLARNCPPNGKIENRVELASTSKSQSPRDVSGSHEPIHAELHTKGSDLPIARRASLHKFLAKRKDRAAVRAPYQLHNQSPGAASSGNEHNFDLNM